MSSQVLIGSVMTPVPHLIESGAMVTTARSIMHKHGFRHLPVTKEGKPFGVISARDVEISLAVGLHVVEETDIIVEDVCSSPAYAVPPEEPLDNVVEYMWEKRISSALIIDREKIIGIFTSTDACRVLSEMLRKNF